MKTLDEWRMGDERDNINETLIFDYDFSWPICCYVTVVFEHFFWAQRQLHTLRNILDEHKEI